MTPFYERDGIRIYCGDTLSVMRHLWSAGERFHLTFTSPPYNLRSTPWQSFDRKFNGVNKGGGGMWKGADGKGGVDYDSHDDDMPWPEYETWQRRCLAAMWRLTDDDGAVFYNHKPRLAGSRMWHPRCLVPASMPVRQEVVWARSGGINYNPHAYVPTYEVIMVIARDAWRLKSRGASSVGDVWDVHQVSASDHPAPFPVGLPARAIETCAPRNVLDPFCGSGTTLRAALDAGVPAVGIDRSERYCEMAARRLDQGSLFA